MFWAKFCPDALHRGSRDCVQE